MFQQSSQQVFWGDLQGCLTIFSKLNHLLATQSEGTRAFSSPKDSCNSTYNCREGNKKSKSINAIVISCSRNKVQILSAKDASLSRIFSMVCLIRATYVCKSFLFCNSISSHACGSFFRSSNLSLFCFVIDFRAMLVAHSSSLQTYLYIAAFVLQKK